MDDSKAKGAGARRRAAERDEDSETATTARSRTNARQDRPFFKVVAAAVLTQLGPRAREAGRTDRGGRSSGSG